MTQRPDTSPKEPAGIGYHRPTCPVASPFGQIKAVRAYCNCDDHGGLVSSAEFDRLAKIEYARRREGI